eukprot:TRINITY_DN1306_c4_g1_i1.p1 TRINITY_DN1306_c4_g1~~TRINITY_DN1306_c4_g1_i1.p1  ORF type:complete len:805 (+),score=241.76 TRINITY_DN1306_c4_g1_i1:98-2512(+)
MERAVLQRSWGGVVSLQRRTVSMVFKADDLIPKHVSERQQVKDRFRFLYNDGGQYADTKRYSSAVTRKRVYYRDRNHTVAQMKFLDTVERRHDLAALGHVIGQDAGDPAGKVKAVYQLHPSDVTLSPGGPGVVDVVKADVKKLRAVYPTLYFTLYCPGRQYGGVEAVAEAIKELALPSFKPLTRPTWIGGTHSILCRVDDASPLELTKLNEGDPRTGLRVFNITTEPPPSAALTTNTASLMLRGLPDSAATVKHLVHLVSQPSHGFPNYIGWDLVGLGPEAGVFSGELGQRVGVAMLCGAYDEAAKIIVRAMHRVNKKLKETEIDLNEDAEGKNRISAMYYNNLPPRYHWVKEMLDFMANYGNKKWPEPALTTELPFEVVGRFPACAAAHVWNAALDARLSLDSEWAVDGDYVVDEETGDVSVFHCAESAARVRVHAKKRAEPEAEVKEDHRPKIPEFIKPKSLTQLLDDADIDKSPEEVLQEKKEAKEAKSAKEAAAAAAAPRRTPDPARRIPISRVVIPTIGSGFKFSSWPDSLGGSPGLMELLGSVGFDVRSAKVLEAAAKAHLAPTSYRRVVAEAKDVKITAHRGALTGYVQNYAGDVLHLRDAGKYYNQAAKAVLFNEPWECIPCNVINHDYAVRCRSCDTHRSRVMESQGQMPPEEAPVARVITVQVQATLPHDASPAAFVGEAFHLHAHLKQRMAADLTHSIEKSLECGRYVRKQNGVRKKKRRRSKRAAADVSSNGPAQLPYFLENVECSELRFNAPSSPVEQPRLSFVQKNEVARDGEQLAARGRPGALWHHYGR